MNCRTTKLHAGRLAYTRLPQRPRITLSIKSAIARAAACLLLSGCAATEAPPTNSVSSTASENVISSASLSSAPQVSSSSEAAVFSSISSLTPSSSAQASITSLAGSTSSSSTLTTITLEENDSGFCTINGAIESQHAGFNGSGYANSSNEVGASISWQIASPSNQTVNIEVRYANGGAAAREGTLGTNISNSTVTFGASTWDDWQTVDADVSLQSGSNTLTLTSLSNEGLANIDAITINGNEISAADCPLPPREPIALSTDRWFKLQNRANNLVMAIQNGNTQGGAALIQTNNADNESQQFRFEALSDNYYRVIARHSGLALDLFESNPNDGADFIQWQANDGQNQAYQALALNNGFIHLINQRSQKALLPEASSQLAGSRITQAARSNDTTQQWQLLDIEPYSNSQPPTATDCGAGTPDAVVTGAAGNYSVNGTNVGGNYYQAITRAIDSLSSGRNSQERVTVMASGNIGDNWIDLPSNIIFEVCGTMNVGLVRGRGAVSAINKQNVSIPHLKMTGSPWFGFRFAGMRNLHLGNIEIIFDRGTGAMGIRFERDLDPSYDVTMDYIHVENTGNHGVETWNIDGLEIGTIVAHNTAYAGLLLNNTRNAEIGLVDGENTGSGTGYATLRFANTNGRIGGGWPTNIYVDRVISRGGGRGFFCVSNSGGAVINNVDFANNGNNAILIENCHNITINGGTINGGGEVRIAARDSFPNTSDVTISNLTVRDNDVRESPCGDNVSWPGLMVAGGSNNTCR